MSVVGQLVSTWKKHEERYLPLDPEDYPLRYAAGCCAKWGGGWWEALQTDVLLSCV
jgi:hypothetical protein